MSTVKANRFSPQSLPISQIDGFNDVESFTVATSQTSFSSANFDSRTQVRAFRRNSSTNEWEEITVVFITATDFEIFEGVTDGEEFVVFYVGGYYQNDELLSDQDVEITSTNPLVSSYTFLNQLLTNIDESAFLESYKDYGIGSNTNTSLDLITSENVSSGIYTIVDAGIAGSLININDGGNIKQLYLPFGKQGIYSRDNENIAGTLPTYFTPIGNVEVENVTAATYTISLADSYSYLRLSDATGITVTVPTNATTAFPIGTNISMVQAGAGAITISPATGVTVNSADSLLTTRAQYSAMTLTKVGVDEWDLAGDIA